MLRGQLEPGLRNDQLSSVSGAHASHGKTRNEFHESAFPLDWNVTGESYRFPLEVQVDLQAGRTRTAHARDHGPGKRMLDQGALAFSGCQVSPDRGSLGSALRLVEYRTQVFRISTEMPETPANRDLLPGEENRDAHCEEPQSREDDEALPHANRIIIGVGDSRSGAVAMRYEPRR